MSLVLALMLAHAEPAAVAPSWICRPDATGVCSEQPYTEWMPDGSLVKHTFTPDPAAPVDCFYVYPTVDLRFRVANQSLDDREPMERVVRSQAAMLGSACRVWAPAYRQATLGTYFVGEKRAEPAFAVAAADIEAAFAAFLAAIPADRGFVLVGHSQGGQQISRLVRRIEQDSSLRSRLVAVYPIGWRTATPKGKPVGGSFAVTPACTDGDDVGCFVAYRTYTSTPTAKRTDAYVEGEDAVCINPARPGSTTHERLAGIVTSGHTAAAPAGWDPARDGLLVVRDAWQARCAPTPDGAGLVVRWSPQSGDHRPDLLELDHTRWLTPMGTHTLDMQLTLLDVVADIRRRAAAWTSARSVPPG